MPWRIMNRADRLAVVLAVLAAFVLAVWLLLWALRDDAPAGRVGFATPAIPTAKTETLPIQTIKVFAPSAKKKLKLPAAVKPDQHVIAASRIEPDAHPKTLITLVDAETGEFETIERVEPLPWIAASKPGSVGAYYGIKRDAASPIVRVVVQQSFLQIKALRFGGMASADSDGEVFAGVGVSWQW